MRLSAQYYVTLDPSHTPSKHKATVANVYTTAIVMRPSSISSRVSKENAEKVVKPPSTPTSKNPLPHSTNQSWSAHRLQSTPMVKEPTTLIVIVTHGKLLAANNNPVL